MSQIYDKKADGWGERNHSNKVPALDHEAFVVLGLSVAERKILIATWKMAKPAAMISRATGIAQTTLPYMLRKLEKRFLLKKLYYRGPGQREKALKAHWKCEMRRAAMRIKVAL